MKIRNIKIFVTIFFVIFLVHVILSMFTGKWIFSANPYNSYTLQASSWLQGRLDLGKNYEHLELAIFHGKYYVSFPLFPSYLMLPFVMLFGEQTPDGLIAFIICLIGAWYAYLIGMKYLKEWRRAVFWSLFLYTGTNILFITLDGWVWFFAQNLCLMLSFMTIFCSLEGNVLVALLCLVMSIGCRPFQIVYVPIIGWILFKNGRIKMEKRFFLSLIPAAILGTSYMVLNQLRFGSPWEFGHNFLPEFLEAPKGQFSISYMKENIVKLFRLPVLSENGTFLFYDFDGTAFWLVLPIFLSLLYVVLKRLYVKFCVKGKILIKRKSTQAGFECLLGSLIVVHILLFIAHKTMGGWHFGNRYINDVLPYLYLLLLCQLPKHEMAEKMGTDQMVHEGLYLLGLLINTIGTVVFYLRS